ncbi:MAG: cobalamin-dependent protein [Myxococcaceae bacterium]|nr:cobalamin-dependent protein [Myxococcaceae bacterium]
MRVLLLGAGRGEATCGILYLASYLRRNGVEAVVRLWDDDEDPRAMKRSLKALLTHVKPGLVGISLKWFNHLSRGLELARAVKAIDPEVRVVTGGNSASYFWRELSKTGAFDDIVLGDGEKPLLGLARGDRDVPNVVRNGSAPPITYVQSVASTDVYYSGFDELFLSGLDASSFSGWVQPGKGCSENCVYCGGTRGMEQGSFGRPTSFLRAPESVARDHEEISKRTWQLRYDFAGGTADFLGRAWAGFDLKRHSATYFLWGVPPRSLIDALAATFGRVYLVLDVGCFSQTQRRELIGRGLLKPCPTDAELLDAVAACREHPNLTLEVCAIAGLPHTSRAALAEELPLVEKLLELGCDVGCQRLECQPGALVTRHPDRFGMVADASTFDGFVKWFAERGHDSSGAFPMIRFADAKLERAVERGFEALYERIQKEPEGFGAKTKLISSVVSRQTPTLGEWLGAWRVPAKLAGERLTVLRSENGGGLACAPKLKGFDDPLVESGPAATGLLAALETFAKPARADAAPRELVEGLLAGGFLKKVSA